MNVRLWDALSSPFRQEERRRLERQRSASENGTRHDASRYLPVAEGLIFVESLSFEQLEPYQEAWIRLIEQAVEPNVFMEPAFALPAALHAPATQRPEFVVVWTGAGFEPRARMIGLWTIDRRNSALSPGVGRAWMHKHSALGVPLIDSLAAQRSIGALMEWFGARRGRNLAFSIPRLTRYGPLFELLITYCQTQDHDWQIINEHDRAILKFDQNNAMQTQRSVSAKHRREQQRQRRRLMDLGRLDNYSAVTPQEVRAAMESFLALEAMGWKGRRKTALLSDASDAAFARSMTRLLAREGKCRVEWLALNQSPIAMAIILSSGGRGYFWKTTYDEALSLYSPGVQLVHSLTEKQRTLSEIDLTDSCAIPDHPMIDRVWPDRQRMADLLVGVRTAQVNTFPRIVRREKFWRDMRAVAKTAAYSALGRHRS